MYLILTEFEIKVFTTNLNIEVYILPYSLIYERNNYTVQTDWKIYQSERKIHCDHIKYLQVKAISQ